MSKNLNRILFPIAAILCVSGTAIASENSLSPFSFILTEAGISETEITKNGQRIYTPHIGYESVTMRTKNDAKVKLHGKNTNRSKDIDNIHLNIGQDKVQCEELEKKLTEKYGPAKSQRNNIRIWELNNPNFTAGQSKKITIMAGEEKGQYFLIIDRMGSRTGNNPRTNASLRKADRNGFKRATSKKASPKINRNIRD